ncbi:hypothetical protein ACO22_01717 [Paracoccidioides brasiliensis]|uniref:Uncharacterized protein n=1 Tax=Paracoccidioides brasiliensis TaxID=121759 RepID=A0A1D2JKS8_PARBR|nr:hypothetical protein ACO22_01717 [Paracoccidioides brasiliensis]
MSSSANPVDKVTRGNLHDDHLKVAASTRDDALTEWKWDESKGAIAALHDAAPLADFTSTQKLSPSNFPRCATSRQADSVEAAVDAEQCIVMVIKDRRGVNYLTGAMLHAEQSGYKNQRPTAVSRAQKREGGVPRQSLIRLGAGRHKHRISCAMGFLLVPSSPSLDTEKSMDGVDELCLYLRGGPSKSERRGGRGRRRDDASAGQGCEWCRVIRLDRPPPPPPTRAPFRVLVSLRYFFRRYLLLKGVFLSHWIPQEPRYPYNTRSSTMHHGDLPSDERHRQQLETGRRNAAVRM